jgi:hypothetical protein
MSDFGERYTCRNGEEVTIEFDDTSYTARAFDVHRQEVGRFEFDEHDGPVLKLVWAYLDRVDKKYKRQGIGCRILQIAKERYGMPIVAEDNDGLRKDDGSHLTGDAPGFVSQMRRRGLIELSERPGPLDEDQ